jgi:CheY-like chemotaxis protein
MLSMLVWRVVVVADVQPPDFFNPLAGIWGSSCMLLFGREVARRERAETERDALPGRRAGLGGRDRARAPELGSARALIDIGMPHEDGYSLVRRIRKLPASAGAECPRPRSPRTRATSDRHRAISAGFQDHLPKSIDVGRLVHAIRDVTRPLALASL